MVKRFALILLLSSAISPTFAQDKMTRQHWVMAFDSLYYYGYKSNKLNIQALKVADSILSKSNNVFYFQPLSYDLDALNAMYQATGDKKYVDYAIVMINNVIGSAQQIDNIPGNRSPFKGRYKGWVVVDKAPQNQSLYMKETALSEAYIFQYVCKLLYLIHINKDLQGNKYQMFYKNTLSFIENDIWDKWYSRGYKLGEKVMLNGRTHTESHWAYMACILYKITNDAGRKAQYLDAYTTYNKLLKGNFRTDASMPGVHIWNSTWDSYPDKSTTYVQDVSHGNIVVSYLVEANGLNIFWTNADMNDLCSLVKNYLWVKNQHTFQDNLNLSAALQTSSKGTFQSDGWIKLGRYDRAVQNIYVDYVKNNPNSPFAKSAQLFANLALNEKILSTKGL